MEQDYNHEQRSSNASTKASSGKRSKSPSFYRKQCDLCRMPNDVLVRCRIDESLEWHFVCTKKCWKRVSGGEIDGPDKPFYVYGGMWKNKHAGTSAKKPKRKEAKLRKWNDSSKQYITNDKVSYDGRVWICRKSHKSSETTSPRVGYAFWKEFEASIIEYTESLERLSNDDNITDTEEKGPSV